MKEDNPVIHLSLLFLFAITQVNCKCTVENSVIDARLPSYRRWSYDYYFLKYGEVINCTDIELTTKVQLKSLVVEKESGKNAQMIVIENSKIPVVETAIFDSYRDVRKLYLNKDGITDIQSYAFAEMSNLTELRLINNKLEDIKDGSLNGINKLKILNLSYNRLKSLSNINVITTLESLNISNNLIDNLQTTNFKNLDSLTTLDLSNNRLTNLSPKLFQNLPKLTDIFLRNNTIEHFSKDLFAQTISNVDISYNNLKTIECEQITNSITVMFNPLDELCVFNDDITEIDYSEAELITIPEQRFKNLNKLTFLNLSMNFLVEVHVDAFENLYNLTTLSLSVNDLTHLSIGTFHHLNNLQLLNLSWNQIEDLELGIFTGLNSLITLDLSNNAMRTFKPEVLYPVKDLEVLYLHGNLLYTIDTRTLTNHLTYLKKFSVNFEQIGCDALMYTMNQLRNERVEIKQGHHVKGHNVHGIECDPKIEGSPRKNYEEEILVMINYISTVQTIFILTVIMFIILLIIKSMSIYNRYFENCKRRITKPHMPSCSLTLLTENDHD